MLLYINNDIKKIRREIPSYFYAVALISHRLLKRF